MNEAQIDAYSALLRLEEELDEPIEEVVAYWRAHERDLPATLSRAIARLAEAKAECDRAGRLLRFDPFTGEGVTGEGVRTAE